KILNSVPEFFHEIFNSLRIMPSYFEMDDIRIKNNSYKNVTKELLEAAMFKSDGRFYKDIVPGGLLLPSFIFVLAIFSLMLYYLIGWLLNRIFLWETIAYYSEKGWRETRGYINPDKRDEEDLIEDGELPFRLLVVSVPGSERVKKLKDSFCDKHKCKIFDLAGRETLEEFGHLKIRDLENFVLTNIDALLHDLDSFCVFLSGMERLALDEDKLKRVLVFSYSTVDELIEKLRENIDFEKHREEKGTRDRIESYIGRLEKLSGAFTTVVMDIGPKEIMVEKTPEKTEIYYGNKSFLDKRFKDILVKEIKYGYEHLILQVQGFNKGYYYSLWNALSLRDKHTVYDLAESGFVNYKNISRINHLIEKGIFRVIPDECRIVHFNNSFRNFVLSAIHKSEFKAFAHLNKHEGNWHSLRVLIGVVLLILLAFISYVDASVLNKFMGILGSGVATIGLLGRALASVGALSLSNLLNKQK
ncbi:MAG: hypothetical protein OEY51_10645, partial [Cyclobacteriaceae bacterium]|nr:hypothetical protein [Cyclobacteriaceae bacterium]